MAENTPTQVNEEIDLGYLFKKIGLFLKRCIIILFNIISFFIKHKYTVIFLILIGIALGFLKDSFSKPVLINEVIVVPNFGSVDYLYDKTEALNAKIQAKDSVFLKTILGDKHKKLKEIEVEHIDDLFNNVSNNGDRVELFDILSQSKEADEFLNYYSITKTYKHHRLTFKIEGKEDSEDIVSRILEFLNNNPYYQDYQDIYVEHNSYLIDFNLNMLNQIDSILAFQMKAVEPLSSQVLDVDEKNYIPELIDKKREISQYLLTLKRQKSDFDIPIKLVKADYNLIELDSLRISSKILYPILLIVVFCLIFVMKHFYKKMKLIALENKSA